MHELREWKKSFTDVQKLTDELMITRGRARGLKQEVQTIAIDIIINDPFVHSLT